MKKEQIKETERKLQADCFQWFHNSEEFVHLRKLLYHVPNGGSRNKIEANLLKASGVVSGVPDLVFHYRKRTYFFELKAPDGSGVVSDDQEKMHKQLDRQGFQVWLIDSLIDFQQLIKTIINDTSEQFTLGLTKEDYYYRHKIFDFIYKMGDCQMVLIDNICDEDNLQKFLNFVTEFISEGFDKLSGFELLFTPDYLCFYKKENDTKNVVTYQGKTYV